MIGELRLLGMSLAHWTYSRDIAFFAIVRACLPGRHCTYPLDKITRAKKHSFWILMSVFFRKDMSILLKISILIVVWLRSFPDICFAVSGAVFGLKHSLFFP
jgi:hypothetical protein